MSGFVVLFALFGATCLALMIGPEFATWLELREERAKRRKGE